MSGKIKNTVGTNELKNKLLFLKKSLFEQDEIFGGVIAVTLRTLLHDTNSSHSLLSILNLKNRMFLSTNTEDIYNKSNVYHGLVRQIKVGVNDGKGGEIKYWPLYDEKYFKCSMMKKFIPFDEWWKETILKNDKYELTRKDVILICANKDGGAHYDELIEKKYDEFRHNNVNNSYLIGIKSGMVRGCDNAPIIASIKEIAYEVIETFNDLI